MRLSVPAELVMGPVYVFTPDNVSAEVAELCVIPVTLAPITAEMVVGAIPVPELVMVPVLLTEVVKKVTVPLALYG